jgi:hypothetical protein
MKKTKLSRHYLGSRNFSETDFISAETTHLDREKVPFFVQWSDTSIQPRIMKNTP